MDKNVKYKLIDKIESIIKHIITSATLIACVYIISDKINHVAEIILYFTVVIAVLIMYIVERHIFIGNKTAQMTEHSQKLEKKIDKNRSSSNLTAQGKTNPEDK